jgi:hypothetical protein
MGNLSLLMISLTLSQTLINWNLWLCCIELSMTLRKVLMENEVGPICVVRPCTIGFT